MIAENSGGCGGGLSVVLGLRRTIRAYYCSSQYSLHGRYPSLGYAVCDETTSDMRVHGDVNQPTSPADVLEMPHVCMFAARPPNKVAAKATQEQLGPRTKHMIGQNKKVSSTIVDS